MQQQRQLPTLAELHYNPQQAFKNDQLLTLLNQPPHASWLKQHPLAKAKNDQGQTVPALYLPIDKVEFLLTRIFQEWRVEIKSVTTAFQSIVVHVRLHLRNPLTGEWFYQDGAGASPVQTDAGKSAADLGAIKSGAVQMAVPAAESYAIKDAAEKLGTLFGKDLNRRDVIMFAGAYGDQDTLQQQAPQQQPAGQYQAPQQQQPAQVQQPYQPQPLPMGQFAAYRDKVFPDAQPQQPPTGYQPQQGHPQQPQFQPTAQQFNNNFNPSAL